jgi:very-short-patch-repair endonuclease
MVSNNKKLFEITKAYVNNNIPEDYDAISIIDIKVKGISSEEIIMNKILTAKGIKLLAKPGYFRIRGIGSKRFDFAFEYTTESKLQQKIIIEIDGQQHFKPVSIFDGLQGFDRRIEDDILKTNIALKLGYRVFRFSQLTEPKLIKNLDIALNSEELFWCDNPDIYKHIISELPRFK